MCLPVWAGGLFPVPRRVGELGSQEGALWSLSSCILPLENVTSSPRSVALREQGPGSPAFNLACMSHQRTCLGQGAQWHPSRPSLSGGSCHTTEGDDRKDLEREPAPPPFTGPYREDPSSCTQPGLHSGGLSLSGKEKSWLPGRPFSKTAASCALPLDVFFPVLLRRN